MDHEKALQEMCRHDDPVEQGWALALTRVGAQSYILRNSKVLEVDDLHGVVFLDSEVFVPLEHSEG
jgi:hypothetical protein